MNAAISTAAVAAVASVHAAVLLPGYFWMLRKQSSTAPAQLQQQQQPPTLNSTAVDAAVMQRVPTPCPQGFFCPGGMDISSSSRSTSNTPGAFVCPQGMWTKRMHATSIDDCSEYEYYSMP
jgi:hypothetical protein